MTNSVRSKIFDCVQSMREIRDGFSREIETLNHDELAEWIRSHRYANPLLDRLAKKVPRQVNSEHRSPSRR